MKKKTNKQEEVREDTVDTALPTHSPADENDIAKDGNDKSRGKLQEGGIPASDTLPDGLTDETLATDEVFIEADGAALPDGTDEVPLLTLGDTGVDAPVIEALGDNAAGDDDTYIDAVAEIDGESETAEAETDGEAVADGDIVDDADVVADDTDSEGEAADAEAEGEAVADEADGESDDEDIQPSAVNEHKAKTHTDGEKKQKKQREVGNRRVDSVFEFVELFVFTLAAVLIITSFFVRHSVVEGDSMLGTLHNGETLLISDFLYEPKVGDIVVVDDRSAYSKPIIKRVIAVGGDTVRITKNGVIVNGVMLDEPYVFTDNQSYLYKVGYYDISPALRENGTLTYESGVYYEFTVPEGELFVMGDHRNNSTDSRDIGTVKVDAVLGRVIYRILPFNKFGQVE